MTEVGLLRSRPATGPGEGGRRPLDSDWNGGRLGPGSPPGRRRAPALYRLAFAVPLVARARGCRAECRSRRAACRATPRRRPESSSASAEDSAWTRSASASLLRNRSTTCGLMRSSRSACRAYAVATTSLSPKWAASSSSCRRASSCAIRNRSEVMARMARACAPGHWSGRKRGQEGLRGCRAALLETVSPTSDSESNIFPPSSLAAVMRFSRNWACASPSRVPGAMRL